MARIAELFADATGYGAPGNEVFSPTWRRSGELNAERSEEQAISGTHSLKVQLTTGQTNPYRSGIEQEGTVGGVSKFLQYGNSYWVGFALFVPADFTADEFEESIFCLKAKDDAGEAEKEPPISIRIKGEEFVCKVNSDPFPMTAAPFLRNYSYTLGKVIPGTWHRFVVQLRAGYMPSHQAFLKVWMNERAIFSDLAPNAYNDVTGPYGFFGLDKPAWKNGSNRYASSQAGQGTRTYYIDEIRFHQVDGAEVVNFAEINPTGAAETAVGSPFTAAYLVNGRGFSDRILRAAAGQVPSVEDIQNIVVGERTAFSVDLSWDAITGATGYKVRYRPVTISTFTTQNFQTNSGMLAGLQEDTAYEFQVQAVVGGQDGPLSDLVPFATIVDAGSGQTYDGTVYYIDATGGDDANDGSEANPWQSLGQVATAIAGLSAPAAFLFKRGETWVGGDFLTQTVSGANDQARVQFGAYGVGDKPKILGSDDLSQRSWTQDGTNPNLYYLDIALPGVGAMWVDDVLTLPCRSDLQTIDSGGLESITSAYLNTVQDLTGAQVTYKGNKYAAETQTITGHSGNTISWVGDNQAVQGNAGNGFYIYNSAQFCTDAGDWYYDIAAGRLYMLTSGGAPAGDIRVPQYDYGFRADAKYYEFNDLQLNYYHRDAYSIEDRYVYVFHGNMNHNYNSGWTVNGADGDVELAYCEIGDIAGVGVYGENADNSKCHHNYIYSVSETFWGRSTGLPFFEEEANNHWATGITWRASTAAHIHHNHVERCGYNCIRFDGADHIIENNYVHDGLLQFADGGLLYSFSGPQQAVQTNNCTIRNNVCEDAPGFLGGFKDQSAKTIACSIYFDLGCQSCTITGNVIRGAGDHGLHINYRNNNHVIEGNVFYDNPNGIRWKNFKAADKQTDGHICRNNLFVLLAPNQVAHSILNQRNESTDGVYVPATFSGNTYVNPYGALICDKDDKESGNADDRYDYSGWLGYSSETGSSERFTGRIFASDAQAKNEFRLIRNPSDQATEQGLGGNYIDINQSPVPDPATLAGWEYKLLIAN